MSRYTQAELLRAQFTQADNGILDGLLKQGLYVLGSGSKIGKSMVCTDLANAVAEGTNYLGMSNQKGRAIYFDNDNSDQEAQGRVKALMGNEIEEIVYFTGEDANSMETVKRKVLEELAKKEYSLVIIDTIANLEEYINTEDNYKEMNKLIKDFKNFFIDHHLTCIALHHKRKGNEHGQDSLIGSRALSAASTGFILLNVKDEFSPTGSLDFILRSQKKKIPIKKDFLGISWMVNDDEEIVDDYIQRELLMIIKYVVRNKDHKIEGSPAKIVTVCDLPLNPAGLTKYLKRNEAILEQNNVHFEANHKKKGTYIHIEYKPTDENEQ